MLFLSRLIRSFFPHCRVPVIRSVAVLVLLAGAIQAAKAQISVAVGATSATQSVNVTITTAGTTPAATANAFPVLTQGAAGLDFNFVSGGSCAVSFAYTVGKVCTVQYTFKPRYSGTRLGAVQVVSNTGVVMGTAYISGIGTGPQAIFPQTTINPLSGSYDQPRSIAIDGAGNVYVANFGGGNVLKLPVGCTTSSCVTTIGTFTGPASVAVDGAGNLFVADYTAGSVSEIFATGCSNNPAFPPLCQVMFTGGTFSNPIGIAVDGVDNVYVADFGSTLVLEIPADTCSISEVYPSEKNCEIEAIGGYAFNEPQDVAVDASGTVYVADYGNNAVKSMPANCFGLDGCTITTLGGGFSAPSGVAVDGNGNVYVGDSGNDAVKVMTPNCTPANENTCVTTIDSAFSGPIGVTLDGSGDLYVADNGNNAVREIPRATAPSVTFPSLNDGSPGTPQTVTLSNFGNQPLTFAVPSSGVNPTASSSFSLATTGTGACPSVSAGGSSAILAANASCTLTIDFNPASPDDGTVTGSVVLKDNNANVAGSSQTIALGGTATELVPVITSISPANGLPSGATTITINGSLLSAVTAVHFGTTLATSFRLLSDTQMTAVSPAHTAAVVDIQITNFEGQSAKTTGDQFTYTDTLSNTIDFPALANAVLGGAAPTPAATATSGQPVTYSSTTPFVCTIAGTSITDLQPGVCTISASQSATGNYAAAAAVSQSFDVLVVQNIGVKSATLTASLTFTTAVTAGTAFTTSVTTAGATGLDFAFAAGGTCASGTAYAVGATCTVKYTFKPLYAGVRTGGIALTEGTGTSAQIVASAYIGGEGEGPQLIFPQFSPDSVLYGSQHPFALDENGTLYVLDFTSEGTYFITVIPPGCETAACQTQLTSLPGASSQGLAVDGIGNLYLTDYNGAVYVLPPGCRAACASTRATIASPLAVAVDKSGNLYVAGGIGLWEIPFDCFSSSCYENLGGGVGNLKYQTMAIDFAQNVYFVGSTSVVNGLNANSIFEMSPNCLSAGCVTSLGGGNFQAATGVAVDPNGNVYLSNYSDGNIDEMPPNCFSVSCLTTLYSSQAQSQFGILLDAQGNLYFSSNGLYTGYVSGVLKATRGTISSFFVATTEDGQTSAPETTSILNYGNQPLVFSVPPSGAMNPSPSADFTLQTGQSGECPLLTASSGTATLAANATCTLPVEFAPVSPANGTINGSVILTDNNLNASSATQTIGVTGVAVANPTVTSIAPLSGPTTGGTAVTITGSNFSANDRVYFGSSPSTQFFVNSSTSITAYSPANAAGTVDVTVVYDGATSPTSTADQFTYLLSESVGSTSATQTTTVTITTAGTLGAIYVLTTGQPNLDYAFVSGGSCSVGTAYAANATCTVEYTFKPRAPGQRLGAVQLVATGGTTVLGTTPLTGTGTGAQVVFPGNTNSTVLGSGFDEPYSMAVDAAGNVYVADFENSAVKEIVAVSGSIPASPTVRTLGSGFKNPTGVAVDGAGNVYVADFGNGAVKKIAAVGGSIPANSPSIVNLEEGTFQGPLGVAVDGTGNIFVSDASKAVVEEIVATSGSVVQLGSGFDNPEGIAVDGSGNVFVADYNNNAVKEIVAGSGATVTLSTGTTFDEPNWVAVDAAGDVYVADGANGKISEIVAVNGSIPSTDPAILPLGTGLTKPTGVALDGAGNLYVADYGQSEIFEIATTTAASLSFPATEVGSTSAAQTFSLQNIGNQALTLPAPGSGKNPAITAGFTLNAASTCPAASAGGSAGTLAEGTLCTESISFMPLTGGSTIGALTFTDNALNVTSATQTIGLSGAGNAMPTVTAISPTSGTAAGGNSVTITGTNFLGSATVSFGGTAATGVTVLSATELTAVSPAGNLGKARVTVTTAGGISPAVPADEFTYTAIQSSIIFPALANASLGGTPPLLNATSTSPQPILYTSTTTSVCTVASGAITDVAGGTCTITASQTAFGNYAAATPVTQSFTVLVPLVFVAGSDSIESYAGNGSLTYPPTNHGGGIGVAVDSTGFVWSVDNSGQGVSRFNALGAGTADYNTIGLSGASALAIDGKSNVLVTNGNGVVEVLSNGGTVVSTMQTNTSAPAAGIAIDISGNVWITNQVSNTVVEVIGGAAPTSPLSTAITTDKPGVRP